MPEIKVDQDWADYQEAKRVLIQHLVDIGFPLDCQIEIVSGDKHVGKTGIVYGPGPFPDSVAIHNRTFGNQRPGEDWEFFNVADLKLVFPQGGL